METKMKAIVRVLMVVSVFLAGCQAQEPYVLVRSVREFRRPVTRELIATSGVTGHRHLRRPL